MKFHNPNRHPHRARSKKQKAMGPIFFDHHLITAEAAQSYGVIADFPSPSTLLLLLLLLLLIDNNNTKIHLQITT
jgi:hypothetical protein